MIFTTYSNNGFSTKISIYLQFTAIRESETFTFSVMDWALTEHL